LRPNSEESELNRKMAPIYSAIEEPKKACDCYNVALRNETDPLVKVQLLTMIAGQMIKFEEQERDATIETARQAYDLCLTVLTDKDILSQRCYLNIFSCTLHFALRDEQRQGLEESRQGLTAYLAVTKESDNV